MVASLLLLASTGCSQAAGNGVMPTELVRNPPICTMRIDVTGELAVPGKIGGFDCYDEQNYLEFLYRESDNIAALNAARVTWISTPSAPLFALAGDGWFILANAKNRDELSSVLGHGVRFDEVGIASADDSDTHGFDAVACSQFASAIIFGYVYEHAALPDNLSSEARELLEGSYRDLKDSGMLDLLPEGSPEVRIRLGNRSQEINEFCADGKELFDESGQ